jgi:hypothetical protein
VVINRVNGTPASFVTLELTIGTLPSSGLSSGRNTPKLVAQFQTDENGAFNISPQVAPSDLRNGRLNLRVVQNPRFIPDPTNLVEMVSSGSTPINALQLGVYPRADLVVEVRRTSPGDNISNWELNYAFVPDRRVAIAVPPTRPFGIMPRDTTLVLSTAARRYTRLRFTATRFDQTTFSIQDSIFCEPGITNVYRLTY